MTDLEDWWDFYSFDNRFWWAFRNSRSRQTSGNRMTLAQYIQVQSRFWSGQSRLRQKQISISQYLTSERDLSARLTLDVIPDGLRFRLVTSRDVHRFWLAREYAYAARVLVD